MTNFAQEVKNQTCVDQLADYIRDYGVIKTGRVSSAQARGNAKKYSYWGAVRYEIRLRTDGVPTNIALHRASSDRRSYRLAQQDLDKLCLQENRLECQTIGTISEDMAKRILSELKTVGLCELSLSN